MYYIPTSTELYALAQHHNYDTSMGKSQWIANMKQQYGNNWRRRIYDKMMTPSAAKTQIVQTPTVDTGGNTPYLNIDTGKLPWEYPVDDPIPWKSKSNIKNRTQCMNQLDFVKCDPSLRFTWVDKSVYDKYGIPQDGTQSKQIPMFQFKNVNGVMTERSQSEIDDLNSQMDKYCDEIVDSCDQRFPSTPDPTPTPDPDPTPTPDPLDLPREELLGPPTQQKEEENFIKKYKYPLIAAGVVIIALMIMKKNAQPTVILTK